MNPFSGGSSIVSVEDPVILVAVTEGGGGAYVYELLMALYF